jgi:hypothetical protein
VNFASNLTTVPARKPKASRFPYITAAEHTAAGCVAEYQECTIGANGRVVGSRPCRPNSS